MNVLWLGDPQSFDVARVGGKAATLSRLASLHQYVPDGFCLPATALDVANPLELCDDIARALAALMACHGLSDLAVAVRSSAVEEDSPGASFAGQHETYLNVTGVEEIVQAIARCRDSAGSERVLEYRRQHGLSRERVHLAVLVQQLIRSDLSAVVFSANPVSGSREEVVINASWGLGESLVGGTVTPDTFVVRKADAALIQRAIADKRRMTVLVPGGVREVDVPRFLRNEASLNDAQVMEVAHLAVSLEATMGYPVDIECAYASGRLYLLQCRPITALE
jgi:phosphoenolpyruvate synthase/pyruvate phosphate dikinase